jgi:hypothetical protein
VANFELALLVETGVIGFGAFMMIIALSGWSLRRSSERDACAILAGAAGGLTAALGVASMVVSAILLLVLGVGVMSSSPAARRGSDLVSPSRRRE